MTTKTAYNMYVHYGRHLSKKYNTVCHLYTLGRLPTSHNIRACAKHAQACPTIHSIPPHTLGMTVLVGYTVGTVGTMNAHPARMGYQT